MAEQSKTSIEAIGHQTPDLAEQIKNSINSMTGQANEFIEQTQERVGEFSKDIHIGPKTKEVLAVTTGVAMTQTALSEDGNLGSAAQRSMF